MKFALKLPGPGGGFNINPGPGIPDYKTIYDAGRSSSPLLNFVISLVFAIGIIAVVIFVIYSGILWATSAGDKQKLESARHTLTYALIGLILLIFSFVIINLIEVLVGSDIFRTTTGPGGGCFIAGTRILTSDSKYKSIEDILEGEEIISYNLAEKKQEKTKVSKVLIHKNNPGGYLVINNKLKVTENHPIWTTNKKTYQQAGELKIGDELLSPNGETIKIASIEKMNGQYTVYNLRIEGESHNYFAENILVHNK